MGLIAMLKTGVQAQDSNPDYRLFGHNVSLFCSETIRNRRVSERNQRASRCNQRATGCNGWGKDCNRRRNLCNREATEVADGQETGEG